MATIDDRIAEAKARNPRKTPEELMDRFDSTGDLFWLHAASAARTQQQIDVIHEQMRRDREQSAAPVAPVLRLVGDDDDA